MLKFKIKIRYIRIFSCLHSSNDFQANKGYVINLEHNSQYILYESPLQTLITTMRLHRNTTFICATIMKIKINSNKIKMQANANKIYKSHKCSQFIFACWFVGLSIVIFIENILYFSINFLLRFNIEIHLFSHSGKSCCHLLPRFQQVLYINSKCILGECAKYLQGL